MGLIVWFFIPEPPAQGRVIGATPSETFADAAPLDPEAL
jgi:hypothetical protein